MVVLYLSLIHILEPEGIRKLKRDLLATYNALTYKTQEILPIEQIQRDKLKYRKTEESK